MNNNNSLLPVEKDINTDSYLIFGIKEQQYAVNIKNVVEVIPLSVIEVQKNAPMGVIGIFNYKGILIKAVDICPFIGIVTENFNIDTKLIVLNVNGNCFALCAQFILNIISIDNKNILPVPFYSDSAIINNVYKDDLNYVNLIDSDVINNLITVNSQNENKINYLELLPKDESSLKILQERNLNNQKQNEKYSFDLDISSYTRFVLFCVADYNYYIDLKYVREFTYLKRHAITKLPYTQDFVKGIINYKGEFLLVIDLNGFLNGDSSDDKNKKLIIIEGRNYNIAFCVDEIKSINNINKNDILTHNAEQSKYVSGEFIENNTLFSILNVEKILSDERIYINIE